MSTFNELITFIRKEVNRDLKRLPIPKRPVYLYEPIRFALSGNGKRFRPIPFAASKKQCAAIRTLMFCELCIIGKSVRATENAERVE